MEYVDTDTNTNTDMNINRGMGMNVNQKQELNAFCIEGTGMEARKVEEEGKTIYKGFVLDVFRELTKKGSNLDNKYKFNITYGKVGSYDKLVEEVAEGKYDFIIGHFTQTYEREKKVNFSIPLILEGSTVVHIKKKSEILTHLETALITMIKPLLILLGAGFLLGVLIYIFDPDRISLTRIKGGDTMGKFRLRSILTGIATMFGEMGFMSENATPSMRGLFFSILAMTIATIWILFMQAYLTSELIEKKSRQDLEKYLSKDALPMLGVKGHNSATAIKNKGGNVELHVGKTLDELVVFYRENLDKYNGVMTTYAHAYRHVKRDPTLGLTTGFNRFMTGIPVNEKRSIFITDLNNSIMAHKETRELEHICNKYIQGHQMLRVCSLLEGKPPNID